MLAAVGQDLNPQPDSRTGQNPAKLKDAACQFEALLINQLLKSAGEAESGGALGPGDESQADSSMLDIAREQLAQALAKQGGLGIARLVVLGLERKP
jgi:Rod binding domain-containing protein